MYASEKLGLRSVEVDLRETVFDMSYDWHGKRLAVVSADRKITIYNLENDGKWAKNSEFSAHYGPIWKIKWAHDTLGSVIATCSFDKKVMVFEENIITVVDEQGNPTKKSTWENKASFFNAQEPTEDLKFGPRSKGLVLATCSSDGRFYTYDLRSFQNIKDMAKVQVSSEGLLSLTWNKNSFERDMLMVGARGSKDRSKPTLTLWHMKPENSQWALLAELVSQSQGHFDSVYDISWAALNGRSFHYVVSCGKEGVFVWKFKILSNSIEILDLKTFMPEIDAVPICASWNLMATLIVVSCSNSMISLWKRTKDFHWNNVTELYDSETMKKRSAQVSPMELKAHNIEFETATPIRRATFNLN